MHYTIENAVTDSSLLGNIGMQHGREEPSLRRLVRVGGVHIQVHQEHGASVRAFRWLTRLIVKTLNNVPLP